MTFIPLRCEPPPLQGTDSSYRWLSIRECRFPAFVISSESETSFSFAVKKECERSGQWETLCSLCPGRTVFHADRSTQEKEHGKRKRSLGSARDDDTRMPLRTHSSFRAKARNLFRSRQGKGCEDSGEREAPCSLRPPKTVFHAGRSMQEREHGKRKRSLGFARDDDTRIPLRTHDFHHSAMPTSAPSGHLLPWEGGRMPPHRLPIQMAYNTRMPFPRIRHFERKREIFFVRGKTKAVRGTASGKHPAPCAPKKRCFMQTAPRRKKNTANEKDPSAALGMTIREYHPLKKAAKPPREP
jgi:hypothetical protein